MGVRGLDGLLLHVLALAPVLEVQVQWVWYRIIVEWIVTTNPSFVIQLREVVLPVIKTVSVREGLKEEIRME
jgi:hypothetical protein